MEETDHVLIFVSGWVKWKDACRCDSCGTVYHKLLDLCPSCLHPHWSPVPRKPDGKELYEALIPIKDNVS